MYLPIISRLNICLGKQQETNGYAFYKTNTVGGGDGEGLPWWAAGKTRGEECFRVPSGGAAGAGAGGGMCWVFKDQQQTPALRRSVSKREDDV